MIRIGLLISAAIILSGCVTGLWSAAQEQWDTVEDLVPGYEHPEDEKKKSGKAKPSKLFDVEKIINPVKLWSSDVVGDYESVGGGFKPVLSKNIIYVADKNGLVASIKSDSGQIIWKIDLGLSLGGGVGIGGEQIFVGSSDGDVIALDASNGVINWQVQTSSEILSAPSGNGDIAVVQTQDGRVYGLDAQNGSVRWQHEVEVPVLSLRGTSNPVVKGNVAVVGFSTGKLYVFSAATGDTIWENRIGVPQGRGELERMVDIDGDPLLVEDIVYAASHQGRIGAITKTGKALWYQDADTVLAPASGEDHVYIVETNDDIVAIDQGSGSVVWTNKYLRHRNLGPPSVAAGYLLVADYEGYLHILSEKDGDFLGRIKVDGSGVSAPLIVDGDILYALDNNGAISAYKFL